MRERPAALRVDDGGAEAPALALLDPGQALVGEVKALLGGGSRSRAKRRQGGREPYEEEAATGARKHCDHSPGHAPRSNRTSAVPVKRNLSFPRFRVTCRRVANSVKRPLGHPVRRAHA